MKKLVFYILLVLPMNLIAQKLLVEEPLRFIALGDSYTIGQSVEENERWPVQFVNKLKSEYGFEDATVDIIAQTGWTTQNLKNGIINQYDPSVKYNLVSLLIGVNNQYQRQNIDNYEPDFRELLDTALSMVNNDTNRVFIVSIPDYSYTPSHANIEGISEEIDDYNAINREVAREYGVMYFDITGISRGGLSNPDLVAQDGLHPSGQQYLAWVNTMLPRLTLIQSTSSNTLKSDSKLDWPISGEYISLHLPQTSGELTVFDAMGRVVHRSSNDSDVMLIARAKFSSGLYIFNYRSGTENYTGKVVLD